jgi:hypothetical protein
MPSKTEKCFGDCHELVIRTKKWRAGYSIKCTNGNITNTLVSTPYNEENFKESLANFCNGCKEAIPTERQTTLVCVDLSRNDE